MGPYQVPPLRDRVKLGAMAMEEYSAFSTVPALLEPHRQIVLCHIQNTHWGEESYPSAEMQLVYNTALTEWVVLDWNTWSYTTFLRITITYLEPYNYVQTNNHY